MTPKLIKYVVFLYIVLVNPQVFANKSYCSLRGKVKIVSYGGKFKVKFVSSFEDVSVRVVNSMPSSPGEWQFVNNFEDFTIQPVQFGEDFSVRFVNSFSGCR